MATWWLTLNLISTIFLGFYSMMEMACVSFNQVRLQYYVAKGNKRALWLNYLLQHPSRLFGTTLIGVNVAMVVGSECSREFHTSLGLSPDWAPLSQVIFVVIFGELAPMFAARRYAENVSMLGVPLVYASAKLMGPFIWLLGLISKLFDLLFVDGKSESNIFLSQEELMKFIEKQDDDKPHATDAEDFNFFAKSIFSFRQKEAKQIMEPLMSVPLVPSNTTVKQARGFLKNYKAESIIIFHKNISNIIGVVHVRDLTRLGDNKRIRDNARAPWFVTQGTKVMQILKQFRKNKEDVSIILNDKGHAVGLIKLEDIADEMFGNLELSPEGIQRAQEERLLIIEKKFPGSMTVGEFNKQFSVVLDPNFPNTTTLAELIVSQLDQTPEEGDSIYLRPFQLSVLEVKMLEIKTVLVTTHYG